MGSKEMIAVDVDLANTMGAQRDAAHLSGAGDIHFRPDAHSMGVKGELAFAEWSGLPVDRRVLPNGDGGTDFWFWHEGEGRELGIDVKIFARPFNLPVLVSRAHNAADILVLGHDLGDSINFLGWTTKERMLKAPIRAMIAGREKSHTVPARELFPMEQLMWAIKGIQVDAS